MKYITKGTIIDHDDNDREYRLSGVKVRGKNYGMVISGGSGYCVEVRENDENKFLLLLVTEETISGSVAIKVYTNLERILKNFTYIENEGNNG